MQHQRDIGGKAAALERLKRAKFNVPAFFVCDVSWSQQQLVEQIKKELPHAQYFAVRSSASQEDSKENSFAGQFYSALGVAMEQVPAAVKKVQASFGGMPGAVIVQEFIASDIAGVLFTEVEGRRLVINALPGLCEPVVAGQACDEYVCDQDGELIDKTIPPTKTIKVFKGGKMLSQQSSAQSLNQEKLRQLAKLAEQIQSFFKAPQDVEWCFKNDMLYVLQSRPITRAVNLETKEYFDSANIAESYSGIVLPLTCSFAQHVYGQVYRDLLHMSGVSNHTIARHGAIFDRLLGFFYGRMYYNMNNWYALATFLPGYKRNKENFELMITSNVKQKIATKIAPSLLLTIFYPGIVLAKTAAFGLTAKYFKWYVTRQLAYFRAFDFSTASYPDCVREFDRLHNKLLRRWYITVENDFFVMTYLGLLKKLLGEEKLQALIPFRSKATQQVGALSRLSQQMQALPSLWNAIAKNEVAVFNHELKKHPGADAGLHHYLAQFGGRFASELKLESVGVDEDTTKLFALLRAYANYQPRPYPASGEITLPAAKKLAARIVLSKFKKYAAQREEFRLLRSNTFGVSRRLFRRMGELLTQQKAIDQLDDVFYLQLAELLAAQTTGTGSFKKLVSARKEQYAAYEQVTPPAHFATTGNQPPVIAGHLDTSKTPSGRPASPGVVRGRVKIFKEFSLPATIDFEILVTRHTDPGWTSLIALSKGLIIEHGGVLSHASIVARELQIPAIIGVEQATDTLHDGQLVEINGSTGSITLL